ncbi:sugar phosphate nucleotidyltransferase [Haloglycomyces albus]|uniref:phosphocholine cytidylyltransferase family protein n=1 Tax=Haloglycomyces albus TaxID=526067 RepID=UPI00046CBD15|nr:phosphocholine cytidylyltransferase family protein [Haloglycomyces albus]
MRGIILAAGQGQRLRPDTDDIPKTLLPLNDQGETILDTILSGLVAVGITDIAVTVGHAAEEIRRRQHILEERHDVKLTLVDNDHPEWNNAYSLWTARAHYRDGAVLVNGDTFHPHSVEERLMDVDEGRQLLLAVDDYHDLTDEAMKVRLGTDGTVDLIHKQQPRDNAVGEYIGVSLIPAARADDLTSALETTFRNNPDLYYEDAYQILAEKHLVAEVPIGAVEWTEVDDHDDWNRAKELACRS